MIQEKVLAVLYRLGFQPELVDESIGYDFEYEGITFLFAYDDKDSKTITLTVPNLFYVTEENRIKTLEALNTLANNLNFVQPNIAFDSVWLEYQHYLGDNEPTEALIEHMVRTLATSTIQFGSILHHKDDER